MSNILSSERQPVIADNPDAAAASEALIAFLYRAPIGLVQATPDGEVTLINPMSAQLLMPLAPDGDLGNLFDVLAPVAPELRGLVAQASEPGSVVCDALRLWLPIRPGARAGTPPPVLSLSLQRMDSSTLMASLTDVSLTVQQELEQQAQRVRDARIDRLTGLPNRRAVVEHLERVLARRLDTPAGSTLAVITTDIDRFGRVNLTLGQEAGDALLRLVALRITGTVRTRDPDAAALTARLGGDGFAVVIESQCSTVHMQAIAERLVEALNQPYVIGADTVHLGVSVGCVAGMLVGSAEAVLQDAALATRQAKRSGGARCLVFDPALRTVASQRAKLEVELRRAIDEGELFVVYQPIVALQDDPLHGAATGVEALVRWRHPQRGTVPPIEFIGIAEETGLIVPLGDFVLRSACEQMVGWQRTLGPAAPSLLSVNLSAAQLEQAAIVRQVDEVLRATGLPASRLQLEVTESMAAQDPQVQARLHELKALGIRISLDDFGTGYSSLSSLHLLPIDVVKIDRSFVSQLESSPHHRVLVEATVRVARSLKMQTVAEGIETPQQAALLAELLCDKGQGYYFARPLESDAATRWLRERASVDTTARLQAA